MSWLDDKKWSDKFVPEIKKIIGPFLLGVGSIEQDRKECADLVVLRARDTIIACRVRRFDQLKYRNEFTLRSSRPSGVKTELEKIQEGWADWMFYGFANRDDVGVEAWTLIDLDHFRYHLIRNRASLNVFSKTNGDGTKFESFALHSFPAEPPLLIASGPEASFVAPAIKQEAPRTRTLFDFGNPDMPPNY